MVEDDTVPTSPEPLPQPGPAAEPTDGFSPQEALVAESLASLSEDTIHIIPSVFLTDDLKNRLLAARS